MHSLYSLKIFAFMKCQSCLLRWINFMYFLHSYSCFASTTRRRRRNIWWCCWSKPGSQVGTEFFNKKKLVSGWRLLISFNSFKQQTWKLMDAKERFKNATEKEMQVISSLVDSLVPGILGLLLWSLVASCGYLTGTDVPPALKCKIHSVVRLIADLLSSVFNP